MAASTLIGALRVTLGLDSAAFEKGADRAVKKMDAVSRAGFATGRALRGLVGLAGTAAVALGAVFSARSIRDALEYAASIKEVATQLGVTTTELQVYRFAATQVGITQEELEKGLARLTLTIGKAATGAESATKFFDGLGVSFKDAEGNIRPTGDVLLDVADKLAAIPDPAQRAAAVFGLFGRAGQRLIPLLEQGSEGLRQFAKEAEEAGLVLTEGDIAEADRTADKIEALTTQLKVNFSRTVAQNADAIYDLANALAAVVKTLVQVAGWFARNPKIAGLLFGGAVGLRFGGLPGALAGGAAGFLLTPEGQRSSEEIQQQIRELQEKGPVVAGGGRGVLGELFTVRNTDRNSPEARRQLAQLQRNLAAAQRREAGEAAQAALADFGGDPNLDLFGGGGGGGGRGGKSMADEVADIRTALNGLGTEIEDAFDTRSLPKSLETADDLRQKLQQITEDAVKAGVPVSQFSDEMAVLRTRIEELELEGLAREAREFAVQVRETAKDVRALDLGAMTPLEERLASVDERYDNLRTSIQEQIDENGVLAAANEDAARTMADLVALLGQLDAAHRKAADAARAQFEAEQALRDLAAQQTAQQIGQDIGDLSRARGDQGVFTPHQEQLRQTEENLQQERIAALIQLTDFEAQLDEAKRAGDAAEVARLTGIIALQTEYYDLVSATTAQQIVTSQRLQDAFTDFTNGLSDALLHMVTQFDFSLKGIADAFLKLLNDIFLKPALDSLAGSVTSVLTGLFAGAHADGGVIPRGHWGIVGERGPEPVFAGDRPLTVLPNETLGGGGGHWIVHVHGAMSERQARRTGSQLGAAAASAQARARKSGIAG